MTPNPALKRRAIFVGPSGTLEIGHLDLESFLFCGPTGCNSLAQPNGLGIRANKSGDLKGRDSRVCS